MGLYVAFAAYVLHGYFAVAVMLVMLRDGKYWILLKYERSDAQVAGGGEWRGHFVNAINLK